ncbi:hypothetical protein SALBM311S_03893 [Streptomyces alboniger]
MQVLNEEHRAEAGAVAAERKSWMSFVRLLARYATTGPMRFVQELRSRRPEMFSGTVRAAPDPRPGGLLPS